MGEGISQELQEYLDQVAEEIRGGGPPPKHIPIPERWETLLGRVDVCASLHAHDPSKHALHKIGRFDALIERGRGAFGLVFEAIDPILQRRVALKLCEVGDSDTVDDVLAEARLLATISHPNVITVHEVGLYGHDVFIVMELATGKTAHHFARNGPPWQEIVDVYLGAGAGLAAAHEKGIVHGDFKPNNVLVDQDGRRPRVADFGFARIRLDHTPEHEREQVMARGTRGFVAPEVLRGRAADALSDQWSFCASVWRSLEGALPFEAESSDRMLEMIEQTKPRRVKATVPETVRAVLERGLSLEPADRFPSMPALLKALELVRHTAVTPPQVSRDEQLELMLRPPERRRRKGPGWGPFAIMVLIAGASLVTAVSQRHSARVVRPGVGVALVVPGAQPPATGCAVTRAEAGHVVPEKVVEVCEKIRVGNIEEAATSWQQEYDERRLKAGGKDDLALPINSLIVARTFADQAETLLADGRLSDAANAAKEALSWDLKAASTLGKEHAGVWFVSLRAKRVYSSAQSQHSTTPLPSMLP